MSYYPILNAPDCIGWITLCNFSPNNWETNIISKKYINITWSDNDSWRSQVFGVIEPEQTLRIKSDELTDIQNVNSIILISLSDRPLPDKTDILPDNKSETVMPAWRSTLGLSSRYSETSYQGEIDPFPSPGTLLSFCPFLQVGESIENYLLLLNLEKKPEYRNGSLEICDAEQKQVRGTFSLRNNMVNLIALDDLGFTEDDLIVNISKDMCGIPLYLSKTAQGKHLSMEHTHPPASMVIHGNRWGVQKILKEKWFSN